MQRHEASLLDLRHWHGGRGRDCKRYPQILVEAVGACQRSKFSVDESSGLGGRQLLHEGTPRWANGSQARSARTLVIT
jgi:hypothetical protein